VSWIVLVRPEAECDLADARDWYRRMELRLGNDFLDAVAVAMRRLEEDPKRERLYYLNFRRIILRRFPYKIFYQVIGQRVVVFRVLHARQSHPPRLG
jgi:plasmid stabilization system protein ParE